MTFLHWCNYVIFRHHLCWGDAGWSGAHRLQLRAVRHLHPPGGGLGRQDRGDAQRWGRLRTVGGLLDKTKTQTEKNIFIWLVNNALSLCYAYYMYKGTQHLFQDTKKQLRKNNIKKVNSTWQNQIDHVDIKRRKLITNLLLLMTL